MKKMNKLLTTVLVIALAALTLAGCAKKDASPVTTDGSTSMEKVIGTLGEAFKEKEGSYVIQRPFVLVTKTGEPLSANAQKFFDFALSAEAAQYITSAGAVPVNG